MVDNHYIKNRFCR